ncbi:MAG TPA: hypothetical protein VGI39_02935 [Polyangiaceae bacterium]
MPTDTEDYKIAAGEVVLSVIVGDAGIGATQVSMIDPLAHSTTPLQWEGAPGSPQGLSLGAGANLLGKMLLVTTRVRPNPSAVWTSFTAVLHGGAADQQWPQTPKVSSPGSGTVDFVFVARFLP